MFRKKAVLTNFTIFTRKHWRWSLFLIKSQAFRPQTWNFIKKRIQHRCFSVNTAKFLGTPILRNIYELMLLYQNELFTFYYCNVVCCTVLKRHSIYDAIFSLIFIFFFCYIVIFFVNNKQKILTFKLNPLCDKKTAHVKKSFDLFLLYLSNRFFLVLEVLYERSCSTKRAPSPSR